MSKNNYSVECPHCGECNENAEDEFHQDNEDYDGNQKDFKCDNCGKEYRVTIHVEVTYSTDKI